MEEFFELVRGYLRLRLLLGGGGVTPTESDHVKARAAHNVDTVLKTPYRGYERYGSRWYLC